MKEMQQRLEKEAAEEWAEEVRDVKKTNQELRELGSLANLTAYEMSVVYRALYHLELYLGKLEKTAEEAE